MSVDEVCEALGVNTIAGGYSDVSLPLWDRNLKDTPNSVNGIGYLSNKYVLTFGRDFEFDSPDMRERIEAIADEIEPYDTRTCG